MATVCLLVAITAAGQELRCGSCEVERTHNETSVRSVLDALQHSVWVSPADTDVWALQLRLQAPDAYDAYSKERAQCNWTVPVPQSVHTATFMRANYGLGDKQQASALLAPLVMKPLMRGGVPTSICVLEPRIEDGQLTQLFITRTGPINVGYRKPTSPFNAKLILSDSNVADGWVGNTLIPAMPTNDTVYLKESFDGYFDAAGDVAYPPLHPHHANSAIVGFPKGATQRGTGVFQNWSPWAAITTEDAVKGQIPDSQSSMNVPGKRERAEPPWAPCLHPCLLPAPSRCLHPIASWHTAHTPHECALLLSPHPLTHVLID